MTSEWDLRATLNAVWHRTQPCSTLNLLFLRSMTETDDFARVEQKLENALLKLKLTKDPKSRALLLRELRRLLAEADRIILDPRG
jgi:hypothetical protein